MRVHNHLYPKRRCVFLFGLKDIRFKQIHRTIIVVVVFFVFYLFLSFFFLSFAI